jgi:hypothetical protein
MNEIENAGSAKNGGHCCPPFRVIPHYGLMVIEKPGVLS